MKNILLVIGTRPEAIKIAPLIIKLQQQKALFNTKVCLTAQHRQMLDQVLEFFEIKADYDLDLMKPNQNLHSLTSDIITAIKPVYDEFKPDWVLVHGDTTTSTAAALAAFYSGAKVAHVEAGLRTFNKLAPFPEEMNRSITGRIADLHFAPTKASKQNLLNEAVSKETISITGNTVIDALKLGITKVNEQSSEIANLKSNINLNKKIILVTGHRRENFGDGFENICKALKIIAENNFDDVEIIYPVHLNPNVQNPVNKFLSNQSNIKLIQPLNYEAFIWLMNKSYLIITDSGGVQEEAPSLGKPVLVMREVTERPEAVDAGTVILVGTDTQKIITEAEQLLHNANAYTLMSNKHNPYGDGFACDRIIAILKEEKVTEYE
ncbi:MAG TPA: UDP-N-acetylglucosamine 2-epimerase (non-hydrolyzing) [Chitinophagaceae bacterium]|nr:UDP-N-acetylglucosamine 2-epimerase (non-hydrolyzing) [Chitinophagaceae bacterium]HNE93360.1 UDP-N-acetylglucosamine 2-epimerase (non-hydrolyzing) [Chitinophagaceae bacterium]HNJ58496.1 UDP-N-acetylglucosamine 2-epimerase (non-hydrolyzing) [Chitinophagaceae bacterium]HNM34705.1 UDP-N-acetylglucosamine 2-epimerase (non-hydrolyzing) [Chitinophagaceae bacterium]HNN30444.1 UDP-N-acetylglucosamine 2-epimerase (non-hydrolyzing) [Chitinophagaceae bacterium]